MRANKAGPKGSATSKVSLPPKSAFERAEILNIPDESESAVVLLANRIRPVDGLGPDVDALVFAEWLEPRLSAYELEVGPATHAPGPPEQLEFIKRLEAGLGAAFDALPSATDHFLLDAPLRDAARCAGGAPLDDLLEDAAGSIAALLTLVRRTRIEFAPRGESKNGRPPSVAPRNRLIKDIVAELRRQSSLPNLKKNPAERTARGILLACGVEKKGLGDMNGNRRRGEAASEKAPRKTGSKEKKQ